MEFFLNKRLSNLINQYSKITHLLILSVLLFGGFSYSQLSVHLNDITEEDIVPGDIVSATITIKNVGNIDTQAKLYLTDYQIILNQNLYVSPNTTSRSNASWVNLGVSQVLIPALSKIEIPVEINTPNDPKLSGSYWSLIMVEEEPLKILDANPDGSGVEKTGLSIISRHGLNVITTFENGYPDFEFNSPSMAYSKSGTPNFSVNTENIGTSIARATVYLDIYSSNGKELGRIDIGKQVFRPANPLSITFDFGQLIAEKKLDLAEGSYSALLIVDAGEENLFGARYNLDIQ